MLNACAGTHPLGVRTRLRAVAYHRPAPDNTLFVLCCARSSAVKGMYSTRRVYTWQCVVMKCIVRHVTHVFVGVLPSVTVLPACRWLAFGQACPILG